MEHKKFSKVKGCSKPNRFLNQDYGLEQHTTELNHLESILIVNSSSTCYCRSNQNNNFTIKQNPKGSYYRFNAIDNIKKRNHSSYYGSQNFKFLSVLSVFCLIILKVMLIETKKFKIYR